MRQLLRDLLQMLWLRFIVHPIYARAFESGGITYDEYRETLGLPSLYGGQGVYTRTDKAT